MLFDEEKEIVTKEAINKLREKAKKVSEIIKSLKEEKEHLQKEVDNLKAEIEKHKKRCEFFESERNEISSVVKEIIEEFEQVENNEG